MLQFCILFLTLFPASMGFSNSDFDRLPEVKAISEGMPSDVRSFLFRTVECGHWAGEEPYDKDRAQFIKKAVEKAKCSQLKEDEKSLRVKYKSNQKIIEAITKAKDISL